MRALTRADAASWCRERGIAFHDRHELGYGIDPSRRLEVKLPTTTSGLIYSARLLTRLETRGFYSSRDQSQEEFRGCLIWVIDTTTWSTTTQEIGVHTYSRLGLSSSQLLQPISINEYPARLFDRGEVVAATATLLQPLLFQWDTYVISASGNYIAYLTNDGIIRSIIARIPEMLDIVKTMFVDLGVREAILPQQASRIRPGRQR